MNQSNLAEENAVLRKQVSELLTYVKKDLEIMDNTLDLILRFTLCGRISYVNNTGLKWLQYNLSDLQSNGLEKIVYEKDLELVMLHLNQHQEQCPANTYLEFRLTTQNGNIKWVGVNFHSILNSDNYVEITGIGRDITVLKKTQDELSNNLIRLQTLLVNLQTGILLEDENRKIILTNKMFCKLFDIPVAPEEMDGLDCSESAEQTKHLFQEPDLFVSRINNILQERNLVIAEHIRMKDGRLLERDFIPVFTEAQYLGDLWQYRDITSSSLSIESTEAIHKPLA